MATTPLFGVPLLATLQSQPDVTHNQAMFLLSAVLGGAETITNTPPGSPTDGNVYIVGSSPTGAWAGRANKLAIRVAGAWQYLPGVDSTGAQIAMGAAHKGVTIYVKDTDAMALWTGSAWSARFFLTAGTGAAIPDATGGSNVDAEARNAINSILNTLRTAGVIST